LWGREKLPGVLDGAIAVAVPGIANAFWGLIGGEHIAEIAERLEVYREVLRFVRVGVPPWRLYWLGL